MKTGLMPEGERLRKAVRWLAEQPERTVATIETACREFDLSPAEEEFLIRHFLASAHRQDSGATR
jgi:hypothetical protein